MNQIEQRDPKTLSPHPDIAGLPRWDEASDGFRGFCNDVEEFGIVHPLRILADGVVLDGETRRLAAVYLGLTTVPCEIVSDDRAFAVMLRELLHRRSLTQSAKAFWGYPMFQEAHHEAKERNKSFLKKGAKTGTPTNVGRENIGDFADSIGISSSLFRQSAQVHEIFEKDPAYRAQTLPQINEHGIGLGAVIAGWGGRETTHGKARQDAPEGIRFRSTFRSLAIRCSKCDLPALRKAVAEVVREVPEDQLEALHHLADELRVQVRTRLKSNG